MHIRLTPDDKQLIEQYAKMMNFSMSAFIEILLHRKRIIVCENLGELIIQLSRIGNNINQIAHTANSAKTISNEQIEKVQELMNQVYDQMTRFVDLLIEKDTVPLLFVTNSTQNYAPSVISAHSRRKEYARFQVSFFKVG